jgi:hypothetical protein
MIETRQMSFGHWWLIDHHMRFSVQSEIEI